MNAIDEGIESKLKELSSANSDTDSSETQLNIVDSITPATAPACKHITES